MKSGWMESDKRGWCDVISTIIEKVSPIIYIQSREFQRKEEKEWKKPKIVQLRRTHADDSHNMPQKADAVNQD